MKLFYTCCFVILICSCTKRNDDIKHCWKLYDYNADELGIICDVTETEVKNMPNVTFYHNRNEPRFCWLTGTAPNQVYWEDAPESFIAWRTGNISRVKVACGYCARWFHRIKRSYKPTGNFAYSQVTVQRFCGDTISKLYTGRQDTLKNTLDSLVVRQFSSDGANW